MSVRKIDRVRIHEHRCRLPWWNLFRPRGSRVQCMTCGSTYRWDYEDSYAGWDAGRQWVKEGES